MTEISIENLPFADSLRKYPSVERWLRDKVESTQVNYLAYMVTFSQRSKMNPDEFLQWAKTVEPVEVLDIIDKMAEGLTTAQKFNFKIEMRSFLRHGGYNNLPKTKLTYTVKDWHRGYRKDEVRKLLGFLDSLLHKLYVYVAVESGFRAKTVLALKYKHIADDYEAGIVPVAIRLGPEFYGKKKSAGYSFLGERSVALIKEGIKSGLIQPKSESSLIPLGYAGMYDALTRAKEKANLDPKIQPNHGLRKYFEDALDATRIDRDQKYMLEGHFATSRAKHYTDREWSELRKLYIEAYPNIDVEGKDPELQKQLADWQTEKLTLERENRQLRELLINAENRFDREIKALRELVERRTGQKRS